MSSQRLGPAGGWSVDKGVAGKVKNRISDVSVLEELKFDAHTHNLQDPMLVRSPRAKTYDQRIPR